MLCGVDLHDELAALRSEVGPHVFEDPVAFRAAFDDFVPEGSATTGEVSLLVGAIATGALQRLVEQLALGADPATAIALQGDLLARDRGTTESEGPRWALSVLAHAVGAVPVQRVHTRPRPGLDWGDSAGRPGAGPTGAVGTGGTGGTGAGGTRVVGAEPAPAPQPGRRRGANLLLIGAAVVILVALGAALAVLVLRDDGSGGGGAGDTSSAAASEEVLDEIEMNEAGKTVRVQLVRDGTEAALVLLAERDGAFTEVHRQELPCPYVDTAYDAGVQDQGGRQIYWGWQDRENAGYGEYGEVQIDEEMLISYGDGTCPQG